MLRSHVTADAMVRNGSHEEEVRDGRSSVTSPAGLPLRHALRPDALEAFGNRCAKNFRHWSRWARRQGLGAYRFYDRDIPEFPFAIDCYVPADPGRGGRLHMQEVETGWVQDAPAHAAWLDAAREAVVAATGVGIHDIAVKQRQRRSGGGQHARTGVAGVDFQVLEAGLRFWINLEAYLDTGLFHDHRAMRALVRSRARGRRMLNLFGYTGSFTVYAAAGGAVLSDTVDLSNTYLDWAARNFAANGLDAARHRLVRADVLRWLSMAVAEQRQYDLIVLDPPAFSNSKAMTGVLDIQRDHAELIADTLRLLAPAGELYFSTNLRSFRLDGALARSKQCTDITGRTRAEDFRDPRVHHAFVWQAAA
ncbi:MAG: class I SAM-dependent methyltransferase [Betaproteobacteria bacterium]